MTNKRPRFITLKDLTFGSSFLFGGLLYKKIIPFPGIVEECDKEQVVVYNAADLKSGEFVFIPEQARVIAHTGDEVFLARRTPMNPDGSPVETSFEGVPVGQVFFYNNNMYFRFSDHEACLQSKAGDKYFVRNALHTKSGIPFCFAPSIEVQYQPGKFFVDLDFGDIIASKNEG